MEIIWPAVFLHQLDLLFHWFAANPKMKKKTKFGIKFILTFLEFFCLLWDVYRKKDIKNWPTELKILCNLLNDQFLGSREF